MGNFFLLGPKFSNIAFSLIPIFIFPHSTCERICNDSFEPDLSAKLLYVWNECIASIN
uniref:Uncharacterized protein n=1 Tax=Helianthus annuus TaxID=4232 RepID=A0A251V2W4_HELAN